MCIMMNGLNHIESDITALNELTRLREFCENKKNIIMYGAGHFAEVTSAYLKLKGIDINSFCVSDSEHISDNYKWGHPIIKLSDVEMSPDTGIILGLNRNNQSAVIKNMSNIDSCRIFQPTEKLICLIKEKYSKEINEIVSLQRVIDDITKNEPVVNFDNNMKKGFDDRIKQIKKRYRRVTLVPGEFWIGGVIEEYVCMVKFGSPNPDEYWLFVPANPNAVEKNTFTHPNEYIYYQMQGESFSALTMHNLPFWQYFLKIERDFFKAIDKDEPWEFWLPQLYKSLRDGTLTGATGTEYIKFNADEEKTGQEKLQSMGLGNKYVSVFARDACYAQSVLGHVDKYRANMDDYRNSDFASFFQAARYLNDAGIKTVRIGKAVRDVALDPCIVDYAGRFRSDFMDFYLAKYSSFFFGDPSGIQFFYALFGKPAALTNYSLFVTDNDGAVPLSPDRDLVIYNKFWSTKEKRYLNLSEMLDIGFDKLDGLPYCNTVSIFETYRNMGIVPVKNTADEICDLAKEMVERIDGIAKYTDEDEALQKKYFDILYEYISRHTNASYCNARIGREFLRNNLWLTR